MNGKAWELKAPDRGFALPRWVKGYQVTGRNGRGWRLELGPTPSPPLGLSVSKPPRYPSEHPNVILNLFQDPSCRMGLSRAGINGP